MLTAYVIVRLLHVTFAMVWVGALVYDWLYHTRKYRHTGGVDGLREYNDESQRTLPFWVVAGVGTILLGYESARRLYGTFNPFAWPDALPTGGYILWGFLLALVTMTLGILQVPPKVKEIVATGDPAACDRFLARAYWLGAAEMVVLAAVIVLMVGAGVGGYT